MLSRLVLTLYLVSLFLLPWTWVPPFDWLHPHAQWSDAVFAATAGLWIVEQWKQGTRPRLRPWHFGLALYLVFAALSLLFAVPGGKQTGAVKLLGMSELCMLALITSNLASRPAGRRLIPVAIAATSLLTAAAAIAGLVLFYAGASTQLIGIYGELEPSGWYARVQAGTYNPNLLASFCIFASAVLARDKASLPSWLRRAAATVLWVTVVLTFSRGILGFVLAALIRAARTRRGRILARVATAMLLGIMISFTLWNPQINPARPFDARLRATPPSTRRQAFNTSLRTLVERPLLGSGTGSSPGSVHGAPFDAHFTALNIAATLGLPALVAFSSIFAALWRGRGRPTDLAIWGGVAGLALDALGQDIEDFRHVWVTIGLCDTNASDNQTAL
jgi:O-Antigen ligase